ncbi:MAG: hypothetical protein Q8L29_04435 [archaeon]|nr:hypothetical protein [archaeon]
MVNLIPLSNKVIFDLTPILTHPLGEEIYLALISIISIFLVLWLSSNIFNFKRQDYKTSLFIAIIIATTSFIIRSINLIFSLTDAQKPTFNGIAMIVEIFLLLILIKKVYNIKWFKSIIILIITYFGKFMIMGIIAIVVILFFTTIPQDIEKERMGDPIKIGDFETTKINDHAFNFKSSISFLTRTENITMISLKCIASYYSLFPDENIENFATEYKFKSFKYSDLDLKITGSAYFNCGFTCANDKALMNTNSTRGTKIIFIEGGENITLNFDFIINSSENETIKCTPIINSKNPEFTTIWYDKLFEINYIVD